MFTQGHPQRGCQSAAPWALSHVLYTAWGKGVADTPPGPPD